MVRYHHLLPMLLAYFGEMLQVVFILRHPCGVINSWLKNSKEFFQECNPRVEWEFAKSRNRERPEEFWGFSGWERALEIYSLIHKDFPAKVYLSKYEAFVTSPLTETEKLFSFLELPFSPQTKEFISESTQVDHDDPYSVYKTRHVKDDWKRELDPIIRDAILKKLQLLPIRRLLI
jgi:hypothetical protein